MSLELVSEDKQYRWHTQSLTFEQRMHSVLCWTHAPTNKYQTRR